MALSFSTGFKNAVLGTGSVKNTFDGGFILVYAAADIPADADAALVGQTEVVMYSVGGDGLTGLTLDATPANGVIDKEGTEIWQGDASVTDTALFWRYERTGDTKGLSTTELRIQGTIGGAGADLFVSSTAFTSGQTYTLDFFSLTIPAL